MSRRTNYHFDNIDDEDDDVARLQSKVNLLKKVTIEIGEETREQNRFLRQLDTSADSVWGQLSMNMRHVKSLANSGHNRIVFYLLGFVLFVVIILYIMSKSL